MISKSLYLKLLDAASMQRWNDKIRPVELRELDKQAHKMIIAWFLGKFEEGRDGFDWAALIEGGIFELLERLVLTDLKPQIFDRIREDSEKYGKLSDWVFGRLHGVLFPLGEQFLERFRTYFSDDNRSQARRVLAAAHLYATRWEFDIVERSNPKGYEITEIRALLQEKQERHYDLPGIQHLTLYQKYRNFIDLCGHLRFQLRWGHINMVPRISVLGHMLIVAILSYLFSLEINACQKRCVNNYFTGLFHDLPEVLTRDIISPVKRSVEGLEDLIKTYEREQMEKEVYRLLPREWNEDMRFYTQDEFTSVVTVDGKPLKTTSDDISAGYNEDRYNPRDGEIIKAVDELAAFIEASVATENGVRSKDLEEARQTLRQKYRNRTISQIPFGIIFEDF